jgi:hypothetical protein
MGFACQLFVAAFAGVGPLDQQDGSKVFSRRSCGIIRIAEAIS